MRRVLGIYIEGRLWRKIDLEDYPGFYRGEPISLGRRETCDIAIPKSTVSREHAKIIYHNGNVWIVDSGSTNKLSVNGKVYDKFRMENGMKIVIGASINDPEAVVLVYVESAVSGEQTTNESETVKNAEQNRTGKLHTKTVVEKIKEQIKPATEVKAEKLGKTTLTRRIIAFMADCAIVLFMCVGFCGLLALPLGFGGIMKLVMVLGCILIAWVYFALSESDRGMTLGKSIMGLKVTKYNGEEVSFARATGRLAAKLLSVFTLFLPVFGKGRCLHDLIAGTVVIRTDK